MLEKNTFSISPHIGHFIFTTDIKNFPLLTFISVVFSFHVFEYITKKRNYVYFRHSEIISITRIIDKIDRTSAYKKYIFNAYKRVLLLCCFYINVLMIIKRITIQKL